MTWLFAILSGFMINPYFQTGNDLGKHIVEIKQTLQLMADTQPYLIWSCSFTWPIGATGTMFVLGAVCASDDKNWRYQARFGIDYKNKVWMKKRFYPAERK